MFNFLLYGYVCINTEQNCELAKRRTLKYAKPSIVLSCNECQSKLHETGKKKTNTSLMVGFVVFVTLITVVGWIFKPVYFPDKIPDITFSHPITKVNESDAVVQITLTLSQPATKRFVLMYEKVSGTANANEDFNAAPGQIVIVSGQQEATISIPIVPDRDPLESNETFDLVLTNVEGQPRHTVIIVEKGIDKDLLQKSEVIISELSRLSADISTDFATIKMLENYMINYLERDQALEQRYDQARINIVRARERYLLLFHNALNLDPVVVKKSIINRLSAVEREGAILQLNATKLMSLQLAEYMQTRIPMTDKWIEELGQLSLVQNEKEVVLDKI